LTSTSYPYKENGLLPDGSKVPNIPLLNLLIIRRDLKKAFVGESIVDTGFDGGIYANLGLADFLEGLMPTRTAALQAGGHSITCEVFDVEASVAGENSKPIVSLGRIETYCPVNAEDLSEDVIIGRAIINRLTLQLNGKVLKLINLLKDKETS
jgi:predicted aspartyl protease